MNLCSAKTKMFADPMNKFVVRNAYKQTEKKFESAIYFNHNEEYDQEDEKENEQIL